MGKIIFWIVVVFVVLFALRLVNTSKAKRRDRESRAGENAAGPAETMVRCDKCGVFLPMGDARPVAEGYVCNNPGCGARR
jgi:hypothetical protein